MNSTAKSPDKGTSLISQALEASKGEPQTKKKKRKTAKKKPKTPDLSFKAMARVISGGNR